MIPSNTIDCDDAKPVAQAPVQQEEEEEGQDSVPVLTHRALSIAQRIAQFSGDDPDELQSLRSTSTIDEFLPDVSLGT